MRTALLSLIVVGLFACNSSARDERVGSAGSAIQGGLSDTTHTFAVAVLDSSNSTCSGTLIAPNLVVTARHCVAFDNGGDFVDCASDRFNTPRPGNTFRVSMAASNAKFATAPYEGTKVIVPTDNKFCGNDIALIILDSNVPAATAKPAEPALDPTKTSTYGVQITAIGYGTTASGANDDGSRRRRDNVPVQCIPGDANMSCNPAAHEMTSSEIATGDGLCEGDSGSGAYISSSITATTGGAAPTVIGVLSRASDDEDANCIDAIYTRTDTHSQLIIDAALEAAKAGKYGAPLWAGGDGKPPVDEEDPINDKPQKPSTSPSEDPKTGNGEASEAPAAPPATTTRTTSGCDVSRTSSSSAPAGLFALTALLVLRRKRP